MDPIKKLKLSKKFMLYVEAAEINELYDLLPIVETFCEARTDGAVTSLPSKLKYMIDMKASSTNQTEFQKAVYDFCDVLMEIKDDESVNGLLSLLNPSASGSEEIKRLREENAMLRSKLELINNSNNDDAQSQSVDLAVDEAN